MPLNYTLQTVKGRDFVSQALTTASLVITLILSLPSSCPPPPCRSPHVSHIHTHTIHAYANLYRGSAFEKSGVCLPKPRLPYLMGFSFILLCKNCIILFFITDDWYSISLYPFGCWWISRLVPLPGYSTSVAINKDVELRRRRTLWVYNQKWHSWVTW